MVIRLQSRSTRPIPATAVRSTSSSERGDPGCRGAPFARFQRGTMLMQSDRRCVSGPQRSCQFSVLTLHIEGISGGVRSMTRGDGPLVLMVIESLRQAIRFGAVPEPPGSASFYTTLHRRIEGCRVGVSASSLLNQSLAALPAVKPYFAILSYGLPCFESKSAPGVDLRWALTTPRWIAGWGISKS